MVLIISESKDVSTDLVIEWMRYYDIHFLRLNENQTKNILSTIEFREAETVIYFEMDNKIIHINEITAVWFRRGFISFTSSFFAASNIGDEIKQQINTLLNREFQTLLEFIVNNLKRKKSFNNPFEYNLNKLSLLNYALEVGLKIPQTLITTKTDDITSFFIEPFENIITKPIQDIFELNINGQIQIQRTQKLTDYSFVSEKFHYSLFQKYVEKRYEIRIFFINDHFYSSAIFTNLIDGRDLSPNEKIVRIVPYKLPKKIQSRLKKIIKKFTLESGSIDMLVDTKNDFYFLEINPVGQFGTIGKFCNYYLHEKMAFSFK